MKYEIRENRLYTDGEFPRPATNAELQFWQERNEARKELAELKSHLARIAESHRFLLNFAGNHHLLGTTWTDCKALQRLLDGLVAESVKQD